MQPDPYATLPRGIRSRQYSWTPSERVIARSRQKITETLAAGLPADVTEQLVEHWMWLASQELAVLRRRTTTVQVVYLIPTARRAGTRLAVAA